MINRYTTSSILVSIAMVLGVLVSSALVLPPELRAAPGSAPRVLTIDDARLATPVASVTGARAYASVAYVHQANCKNALLGANGDNDVWQYILDHPAILAWNWHPDPPYRIKNTRLVQYLDFYVGPTLDQPYNHWLVGQPGYCMGDDADITDKLTGGNAPPAGW